MQSSMAMTNTTSKTIQFDKNNPLWNETPKIGVEGLIATVDDEKELIRRLIQVSEDNKKLKLGFEQKAIEER